jgi:nitroreductase
VSDETPGTGEGHEPTFFDVVLRQRATRQFSEEPVGDDLVERCLLAATHAPSAENLQPWVFVVVRDPGQRAAIAELTRRIWRAGAREQSIGRLSEPLLAEVDRGAEHGMGSAPVIVVVCGDATVAHESTLASSVYPAVQNLLLAATALGLGSAMTTLATHVPGGLTEILVLPEKVRPMAVVPLGWPVRRPGPPRRLPVGERAHRDRYDNPW